MEWYYKLADVRGGPVDHDAMCRMVLDGLLPLDARVWREGFSRFLPASILPGFVELRQPANNKPAPAARAEGDPIQAAPLTALMADPWSPPADADLDVLAPPEHTDEPIDQSEVIGVRAYFAGGQMMAERTPGAPGDVAQSRPWVRFWARLIDHVGSSLVVVFLLPLLMSSIPKIPPFGQVCVALACIFTLQALCLSLFGTTPGKALLGISVRGIEGGKLGFGEALVREFSVFARGFGLGVLYPITGCLAYGRLLRNGSTSWDEYGGFVVRHERIGAGRAMLAVMACALAIFMSAQPLMAASREITSMVQAQAKSGVGPGNAAGNRAAAAAPSAPKPKPVRKAPPKKLVM